MTITSFLHPMVDSGYFFDFEWLEAIKEQNQSNVSLKVRYSLRNRYGFAMQFPIKISNTAYLNCKLKDTFDRDQSRKTYSRQVVDLQSNAKMNGFSVDHKVIFQANEKKEFLILFEPTDTDFETFDIAFFMKPEDDDYGLYRLRYEFDDGQVTGRFCERKYEGRVTKIISPRKKAWWKFWA